MSEPRVLVLHNRYRISGGEERAVELHLEALAAAGVVHREILRDSGAVGAPRAGVALLRGGDDPDEVKRAAGELDANVVHVHNMQPLFGPRALAAARAAGARVVLHLHNFRLFCAIGVAFRRGEPCFRCHHGRTTPGFVLNCRGSLPEAAVYAAALTKQLPQVLDAVDQFVAPSHYAVGQLARLGVPAERLMPLPHYLPDEQIADASRADEGTFALVAGRLSVEKGVETAIEAAELAGVPLRVAGDGPLAERLQERARASAAPVAMLGRVSPEELAGLLRAAAVALVPSRSDESFGLAALEAMGAGVPVIATRAGALTELVGAKRCVPRDDPEAMADRLRELWNDPAARKADGDKLIARVRERYSQERFSRELLGLYARLTP
jgi:glycosyltransferase involved in cell wall biosynthesis